MDRFAGTSAMASVQRAVAAGRGAFGPTWSPHRTAIAPGRIELIGNHVDYNGGFVLAAAIDRFVAVALAGDRGGARAVRAVAADAPAEGVVNLDVSELRDWRNQAGSPQTFDYLRGLLAALSATERPGFHGLPATLAIAGDVPIGFGVSSSAALCVSLALALGREYASSQEVVLLAQQAEHRAGTPCGTMDQSASVAGGVIAFDGATLAVEALSPDLGDLVFVVADSGATRSLGSSSYPTRVAESRQALDRARRALGVTIPHLAALTATQLAALDRQGALPQPLAQRARHVVEETARVWQARNALLAGDWHRFGALMTASGRSSATLYEISHPAVEALVATALKAPGVLGARMMGGGEGGTALILVRRGDVPRLEAALRADFYRQRGMAERADLLHVCAFTPGAAVGDSVLVSE